MIIRVVPAKLSFFDYYSNFFIGDDMKKLRETYTNMTKRTRNTLKIFFNIAYKVTFQI